MTLYFLILVLYFGCVFITEFQSNNFKVLLTDAIPLKRRCATLRSYRIGYTLVDDIFLEMFTDYWEMLCWNTIAMYLILDYILIKSKWIFLVLLVSTQLLEFVCWTDSVTAGGSSSKNREFGSVLRETIHEYKGVLIKNWHSRKWHKILANEKKYVFKVRNRWCQFEGRLSFMHVCHSRPVTAWRPWIGHWRWQSRYSSCWAKDWSICICVCLTFIETNQQI